MAKPPKSPAMADKLDRVHHRLNVNLPPDVYEDLQKLSRETSRSFTEIVRTGLSLAQLALTEVARKNKLAVTDGDGRHLKEIVLIK